MGSRMFQLWEAEPELQFSCFCAVRHSLQPWTSSKSLLWCALCHSAQPSHTSGSSLWLGQLRPQFFPPRFWALEGTQMLKLNWAAIQKLLLYTVKLHILAIRHLTLEQFMGHALQHLRLPDHHESRCVAWLQGSAFPCRTFPSPTCRKCPEFFWDIAAPSVSE